MNIKKQSICLLISFFAVSFFIISCKKDDKDSVKPADSEGICKLSSLKDVKTGDSSVFLYDAQNRLIKIQAYDTLGNTNGYETYVYTGNKISHQTFDKNGIEVKDSEQKYTLNADGTIQSVTEIYQNDKPEYDTTLFFYDSEGYLKMMLRRYSQQGSIYHYVDSSWYEYTDGNMTTEIFKGDDGSNVDPQTIYTTTYSTLIDKTNIFQGELFISGAYGKGNKNLAVFELLEPSVKYPVSSENTTYQFELDSKGYITRRTVSVNYPEQPSSNLVFDYKLSYTCN